MYDVADVAVDEVNAALDQFVSKAKSRTTIGYGAGAHIRAMMHKALGADRADNMLARITPPTRSNKLEMLKCMEATEISRIVENEPPQLLALVLAHLDRKSVVLGISVSVRVVLCGRRIINKK